MQQFTLSERSGNNDATPLLLTLLRIIFSVALVLLLLVTPLLYNNSLVNANFSTKTFIFINGIVLLMGTGMLILLTQKGPVQISFSRIDAVLLLFVSYVFINRYLLQSHQGFSTRFIELNGLILLYIILRLWGRALLYLPLAVILSGTVLAICGTLQLLGYLPFSIPGSKMIAGFSNSGPFAGYLACIGTLALGLYLFRGQMSAKLLNETKTGSRMNKIIPVLCEYIPLAGLIAILIVLPAARARAAWIAFLVTAVFLIAYYFREKIKHLFRVGKFVLAVILITAISSGAWKLYHINQNSADGRILVWKVTGNMVRQHPVTGVGFDRFKAYYMNAQAGYFAASRDAGEMQLADNTYYAFNEVLQLLAENGLVGLLLAALVGIACWRAQVTRDNDFLKVICLSTVLSVFVFGLFSYPMQILSVKITLAIVLAMLATLDVHQITPVSLNRIILQKKWQLAGKLFLLPVIAGSMIWIFNEISGVKNAYKNWMLALSDYNAGLYKQSITGFERAYPVLKTEGDYLMQYGKALAMDSQYSRAAQVLEQSSPYLNTDIIQTTLGNVYAAQNKTREAEAAYETAARMVPNRFYPAYLLARLYFNTHQEEKAFRKAKEILIKKVKVPSAAIEEMQMEMQRMLNSTTISSQTIFTQTSLPIEKIKSTSQDSLSH